MKHLTLLAALSLSTTPALAQTEAEAAATNLSVGVMLCLQNYFDAASFPGMFEQAGFTVTPGMDAGTFDLEAPGVWGIIVPQDYNNYCTFQSSLVPFRQGLQIANEMAAGVFGDLVEQGDPENKPTECPRLSIFAPRRLMIVDVYSAGNGGICTEPDSTGIVVR